MTTSTLTFTRFLTERFDEDEHRVRQSAAMDNLPGADERFHRALVEVEMKRSILREHPGVGGICRTCGVMTPEAGERWPCRTVRLLTFPYVSHPDCAADWRA